MKILISILSLLLSLGANAQVDVAVVCQHHENFKNLNKVLCAAAEEVRATDQPIMIEKVLACLYPEVREDTQICPPDELKQMDLPEIPFLEGELPVWPEELAPVLLKVDGKALNTVLPMHASFFNDEFSLETSCASKDGDLRKTDRILCAPFVADLALAEAGKYDGDPRDLIIERLKKQIAKLEAELTTPEPVVVPKVENVEPEPQIQEPQAEDKTNEIKVNGARTKDDVIKVEPVKKKERPKTLKAYGQPFGQHR